MATIGRKIEDKLTKWLAKRIDKPLQRFSQSNVAKKIRNNQKLRERVLNMDKKIQGWGQWTFYNRHKIENFHKWFVRIGAVIIFLLLVLFSLTGCGKKEFSFNGEWLAQEHGVTALDNRNYEVKFDEKNKKIDSEMGEWDSYSYSYNSKKKELIIDKTDSLIYEVTIKDNDHITLVLKQQGNVKKGDKTFIENTITLKRKE